VSMLFLLALSNELRAAFDRNIINIVDDDGNFVCPENLKEEDHFFKEHFGITVNSSTSLKDIAIDLGLLTRPIDLSEIESSVPVYFF